MKGARLCFMAAGVGFVFLSSGAFAEGGIFGGSVGLDPSFCKQHAIRQTVIYVDDTVLVNGQTGWTQTIYEKLAATLIPGERTTLVELSPASGQSTEVWSGCWPAYTADEQSKIEHESHIFSSNPLEALKDQKNFFFRDFGVAAEKVQEKGQKSLAAIQVDPSQPPNKSVLRALASDGARYSHGEGTIRAIVYSDLVENSDLGSVFKSAAPVGYGEKLGTYLRRSVFYFFGVGTTVDSNGTVQDSIRAFWDNALRSMAANIGGFGTDLGVPNVVPIAASMFNVSLSEGSQSLVGKLSLLTDIDGTLVDSWIGITRLRNASVNGSYRCSADTGSCTVSATTTGGVVSMSPLETINLKGSSGKGMSGTIGVEGSNVNLPLTVTPTAD